MENIQCHIGGKAINKSNNEKFTLSFFLLFTNLKLMDASANILNWFEISVGDIARAKKFYETIFSIQMEEMEMMGMKMASFPYDPMSGKLSGALVQSDMHRPSGDGVKIYLNGNPDLSAALSKVEGAGGKIVMSKSQISEDIGYMAFLIDTEGNAVALHSQK